MKLFAALLLIHCALSAQTISVLSPIGVVPPGTSAIVTLNYKNAGSIVPAALQFTISAPGKDTGTIVASSLLSNKALSCNQVNASTTNLNSTLTCILWGVNLDTIPDGPIAQLIIPILPTAPDASVTPLTSGLFAASADGASLPLFGNSMGAISLFFGCDLNKDGVTDAKDVLMVVIQATGFAACNTGDLNKSGKCDLMDAYREILAALPVTASIPGSGVCKIGP